MGTTDEIAAEFGISHQQVDNYRNGRVSTLAKPTYKDHPELREGIDNLLEPVREKALHVFKNSLGFITDQKLQKTTAKDASAVAANMSKIVQNVQPIVQDQRQVLVIYAPKQKELDDFEVIDI
jgi:hypothetical protein